MTNRTQAIRMAELVRDVTNHPNKNELIKLMNEQVVNDTYKLYPETHFC